MKSSCSAGIAKIAGIFSALKGAFGAEKSVASASKAISAGRSSLMSPKTVGGYSAIDPVNVNRSFNASGFLKGTQAPKARK